MKTNYLARIDVLKVAALALTLPIQMLPVAEGATQPQSIDVEDIARLRVLVSGVGQTGIGKQIGTDGDLRYELNGSSITVYLPEQTKPGELTISIYGTYGQVGLHAVIIANVTNNAESTVTLNPYVFEAIAAGGGGGADYKTDIYMDGAGRIILERLVDGSTLVLDEHENPILKRNADGSTVIYDAYQSARLIISANGDVTFNGNVSGAGMEQYILGLQNGKFVHGTDELNFAQVKAAVEDVNKFVYLDFANAFHLPSFIVDSEGNNAVAFASAFTIDGKPHIERVVINEQEDIKVDNYAMLAPNEDGGVEFGNGVTASAEGAFAHGASCQAEGAFAHAEGDGTTASGYHSHAEGDSTMTSGDYSHAEGNTTSTIGYHSHAEGESTTASGGSSHAEGSNTIASADHSHAQGVFNDPDDANEDGAFSHGCGTSDDDRKNAFLIVGDKVFVLGVGGYDGTNHESAQDLATVIAGL